MAEQLAPFKVPRRILVVDEIPKGPDRQGPADRAGERLGVDCEARRAHRPSAVRLPRDRSDRDLGVGARHPGRRRRRRLLRARRRLDPRRRGGRPHPGPHRRARPPAVSIVRAPTPAAMAREVFADIGTGTWGAVPLRSRGSHAALPRPSRRRRRARLRAARAASGRRPAQSMPFGRAGSTTARPCRPPRRDGGRLRRGGSAGAAARPVHRRRVLHRAARSLRDGASAGRRRRGGGRDPPARSAFPGAEGPPLPRVAGTAARSVVGPPYPRTGAAPGNRPPDHTERDGTGLRPDRVRPADRADSRGLRRARRSTAPRPWSCRREFCREILPLWYLEEVVRRPWRWTQLPGLAQPADASRTSTRSRRRSALLSTRRPARITA